MSNRTYGYARISDKSQNEERQIKALEEYGINERDIFVDKQSGKSFENREQYQMLKRMLRENDLIVVKSIDRFGRDYNKILCEWKDITNNIKADIKVLDMPMLDTTIHKDLLGNVINDIVLSLLSFVSETERAFIKQRQREGITIAKNNGIKLGRPKILKPTNFDYIVSKWRNNEMTTKEALEELNLKPNTFYNLLKI
ncbi:MAG: recombinase family protein [Clostridia bacterium]|nr:recombinase family protein [Clostridia bacterium]